MANDSVWPRQQTMKKLVFEKLFVEFHQVLSEYPTVLDSAEFRVFEHQSVKGIILSVRAWLLDGHKSDVRIEKRELSYPSTWWEMLKRDHMPKWFIRRWPVKETTFTYDWSEHHHFVCPHLKVEDRGTHFLWMAEQSGQMKVEE